MCDAPEILGQLFIKAVKKRDSVLYQHLVGSTGYFWGVYFRQLFEEEQKWAIANRPTEKQEGFRLI